jgi:hypothetical protein
MRLYLKNKLKQKRMGQWLRWYSTCKLMRKALSSNPDTITKKKKNDF